MAERNVAASGQDGTRKYSAGLKQLSSGGSLACPQEPQFYHIQAVCNRAKHLTSLNLRSLVCEMGQQCQMPAVSVKY